jgi:hypothetical protein
MSPLFLHGGMVHDPGKFRRALPCPPCSQSSVVPPQSMSMSMVFTLGIATRTRQFAVMDAPHTRWPHAPLHRLADQGTYFVTVGTYLRQHHFRGRQRLVVLHRGLLTVCQEFGWALEAWALFSNH